MSPWAPVFERPVSRVQFLARPRMSFAEQDAMLKGKAGAVAATRKCGQVLATLSVCLGAVAAGASLTWASPCLAELEDPNSNSTLHLTTSEGSWAGSVVALGAMAAAVPAGLLGDWLGRKPCLLGLAVPFMASGVVIGATSSVWLLYLGRFLAGVGTGAVCVLTPMYIAEITESKTRGPLTSCFPLMFCAGVAIPFFLSLGLTCTPMTWYLVTIPIAFASTFVFMPETPTYLLKTGRDEEARRVMEFLRGPKGGASMELAEIRKNLAGNVEKASVSEIFTDRVYLRCLSATLVMFCFQQISGINAVMFYSVTIFRASDSGLDPTSSCILVAVVQVLVTVVAIVVVDKLGRKTFLLNSCLVNCLCLASLGFYFHLRVLQVEHHLLQLVPLASLMLYIVSFSIGLGPVPWVVVGEMLTPNIAGTVIGVSVTANWFFGFLVTKSFAPMVEVLGSHVTFYVFATFNTLAMVLIYLLVPETRGKTAQQVQEQWAK